MKTINGQEISKGHVESLRLAIEQGIATYSHAHAVHLRAVLALLDAAPPATSATCPNATETCSPMCAAWEGRACDCKAAPPNVDPSRLACNAFAPPTFKGRWRDWHRGSGCTLDDGRRRTAAGVEEITALGVDHPAARGKVAT